MNFSGVPKEFFVLLQDSSVSSAYVPPFDLGWHNRCYFNCYSPMFGACHPVTADRKQCHCCVALWLVALASMVLATPRSMAEGQTLLSYSNPFPRQDSMTLWDAPRAASVAVEITLDLKTFSELWAGDYHLFFQSVERSAYVPNSRATLYSGFGQYFPDHPVMPLATNGVGFDDVHWVYVKLCLSF